MVIATGNPHKVEEMRAIFGARGIPVVGLKDLAGSFTEPTETGSTFEENATIKALSYAEQTGRMCLADDSGLEVDALGGAPGVHSARFAALDDPNASGNSPDAANNAKLLRLLADVPMERRTARFRCVMALVGVNSQWSIANSQVFDGVCEGRISLAASGQGGFGYDPLFVPTGFEQSFAELGEEVKNRISHRAKALAGLRAYWRSAGDVTSET